MRANKQLPVKTISQGKRVIVPNDEICDEGYECHYLMKEGYLCARRLASYELRSPFSACTMSPLPDSPFREQYANIDGPPSAQMIPHHPKLGGAQPLSCAVTSTDFKPLRQFGRRP